MWPAEKLWVDGWFGFAGCGLCFYARSGLFLVVLCALGLWVFWLIGVCRFGWGSCFCCGVGAVAVLGFVVWLGHVLCVRLCCVLWVLLVCLLLTPLRAGTSPFNVFGGDASAWLLS